VPAISADDHHSAVNPHKTVQRVLAFALECYFPSALDEPIPANYNAPVGLNQVA
jgi:hypothetical protein